MELLSIISLRKDIILFSLTEKTNNFQWEQGKVNVPAYFKIQEGRFIRMHYF